MNSHFKFLRRVRIHGGECGAVARALHHEVKTLSLPAVHKNVLWMTYERNSMKRKIIFKRIALAVVAALGFGLLSIGPSQAVPFSATLTIDAATDSVYTNETATAVLTNAFSATAVGDSVTIRYTCSTAVGNTCVAPIFYQATGKATTGVPAPDTSNVYSFSPVSSETTNVRYGNGAGVLSEWTDSIVATTAAARSVIYVKAPSFSKAGTYTYSFYSTQNTNTAGQSILVSPFTWTVTVSNPQTGAGTLSRVYLTTDEYTAVNARNSWGAAIDSAIVANRGTTTPAIVGYGFISPRNSAGDTAVVVNGVQQGIEESVTVEVSGPGYVCDRDSNSTCTTAGNYLKSVVLDARNSLARVTDESLTILSDGTAGVSTLTFKSAAGLVLATKTITFTGGISSISQAFFASGETTVTYQGDYSDTVNVRAYVKDSAGTILKNSGGLDRNLYLFSSDTSVIGDINGASLPSGRAATCTVATTTGLWSCAADIKESGTATLTLRDSITVTASTVSFDLGVVTVVGKTLRTATVTLDKATYAPGERAVLTIKGFDTQGKVMSGNAVDKNATKAYASAFALVSTGTLTWTASNAYPYCGSVGGSPTAGTCTAPTAGTYTPWQESGMETQVVTMPTTAGDVSYQYRLSDGTVLATVSAKIVDPNQTATNAAIAASQAAAEAATDAAAEAIDAANAATDAANLAAEAADAATVAAEEARDAADAATAAVEELATQVATLMAALKPQLTTLANTVAKIAKKVKA